MEYPILATAYSLQNLAGRYLEEDEVVLIVDDYPGILLMLHRYLDDLGLPTIEADSIHTLHEALVDNRVALVLLDIDLPDGLGSDALPLIKQTDEDLAVVMLTAMADLDVAMDCIHKGADDFIPKPVKPEEFAKSLVKVLEKRWLLRENRRYQQELEQAQYRTALLHRLTTQMNTVYMEKTVLEEILQAILVGITAAEGLGFNRAFLLLFDDENTKLQGKLAIGPGSREEAGRVWADMERQQLQFNEIITQAQKNRMKADSKVNEIARQLVIPSTESGHILMRVAKKRRSVMVIQGRADWCDVDDSLLKQLDCSTFVAVPLLAPGRSLGVIIADNCITGVEIPFDLVNALNIFAGQASVALEHSRLTQGKQVTIDELEVITRELDKKSDKLIQSERYAAIGQMAGRLVHKIRNPITALGGTARMLKRRTSDPEWTKFLSIMYTEASRVETTLNELFSFVEQGESKCQRQPIYPLILEALKEFYAEMRERDIKHVLTLPEPSPEFMLDEKQIIQLLQHLLRNSIEAVADGGAVYISVDLNEKKGLLWITVTDDGPGFDATVLGKAGEPFFTTKNYGTGMGLSLARRLVYSHGGFLSCANGANGGAELRIELPLEFTGCVS